MRVGEPGEERVRKDAEKRRTVRIQPFVVPCLLRHGTRSIRGYLLDLSPRGAQVVSEERIPRVGSKVRVEARLAPTVARALLPGEVKWVKAASGRIAGKVCGVTFGRISGAQRKTLDFALGEFQRRAAQIA
jgi:hypothetical protein